VSFSFWSDEDRWFVARTFGLGYSLNLKYVAKRLGWIRTPPAAPTADAAERDAPARPERAPRQERLREQIESSKYEDVQ